MYIPPLRQNSVDFFFQHGYTDVASGAAGEPTSSAVSAMILCEHEHISVILMPGVSGDDNLVTLKLQQLPREPH